METLFAKRMGLQLPKPAFLLFGLDHRSKLQKERPELTPKQVSSELGAAPRPGPGPCLA